MTFSVIVCAFNEEQLLPGCLLSLLQQSFPPHEIIVINNASTDRTAAVASIPGIRVVDEPRKGLVVARETGRRVSTGDVLVYVDADCRAPREWLERIAQEFRGPNPPVAVTGPYRFYDWDIIGRLLIRMYDYSLAPATHVLAQYVFGLGAVLYGGNFAVRRDALEAIGGFDTSIEFHGEDTNLARRISKAGRVRLRQRCWVFTSARRYKTMGRGKVFASVPEEFLRRDFPASPIRHHARRRSRLTSHAWIRALPAVRFPCTHDVERRKVVASRGRRSVRPDREVRRPRDYRPYPCQKEICSAAWGAWRRSAAGGSR